MKALPCLLLLAAACGSPSSPTTTPTTSPPTTPTTTRADAPDAAAGPVTTAPDAAPEPAAPDPAQVKADLLAAETAAYEAARPVFETYCASCHRQGGRSASKKKLDHFDMTAYPFGGHHAMEITKEIREVLGIDGGKPTMPKNKPGVIQGDELARVAAWADAFDAAHAGGAHEGHGHDHHGGHHHHH